LDAYLRGSLWGSLSLGQPFFIELLGGFEMKVAIEFAFGAAGKIGFGAYAVGTW